MLVDANDNTVYLRALILLIWLNVYVMKSTMKSPFFNVSSCKLGYADSAMRVFGLSGFRQWRNPGYIGNSMRFTNTIGFIQNLGALMLRDFGYPIFEPSEFDSAANYCAWH